MSGEPRLVGRLRRGSAPRRHGRDSLRVCDGGRPMLETDMSCGQYSWLITIKNGASHPMVQDGIYNNHYFWIRILWMGWPSTIFCEYWPWLIWSEMYDGELLKGTRPGKPLHNYGKSQVLMGKAIFNSYVSWPEGILLYLYINTINTCTWKYTYNYIYIYLYIYISIHMMQETFGTILARMMMFRQIHSTGGSKYCQRSPKIFKWYQMISEFYLWYKWYLLYLYHLWIFMGPWMQKY